MDGLLKSLSQHFSDLNITTLTKVEKGILSDNYLALGKHKYFLHGHRHEELSWITTVLEIEKLFHDRGIPVIFPLTTDDGNQVWEFEGKYFSLLPYIEAIQYERTQLPDRAIESMGKMLGRIHRAGSSNYPHLRGRTIEWIEKDFVAAAEQILAIIAAKPVKDAYDEMAERKIHFQQKLVANNKWQYQDLQLPYDHLIHGDFHEYNVFFDEKDNVSHVFDWEKTAICPRLFEVARSIDFVCFNGRYEDGNFRQAGAFLWAYAEVYPYELNDLRRALYLFHVKNYYSLRMEKAHYLNNNQRPDVFIPVVITYLEYISHHLESLVERLTQA